MGSTPDVSMKQILYITYYWPPSGGAGVQRSLKFVKYLREYGINPVVLTVDPGKATYPLQDTSLNDEVPAGSVIHHTDSFEPLKIISRLAGTGKIPYGGFANSENESFFQRLLRFIRGNFFIPDARRGWVKYACRMALKIIGSEKIDAFVISSPPHSSQLIGLYLKKKVPSCKWIADLRDPWTDIYYYKDLMHTSIASKLDRRYEKSVLEKCDAAIVVSEDIRRLFLSKSTVISRDKIHVIPNGFDEDDFEKGPETDKDKFLITYVGTLAENYNPEVFFACIRAVYGKMPGTKIRLRFVGSISGQVKKLLGDHGLESLVELIPHVSHKEAIRYMQAATLLLLLIPEAENDKGILTGKLFEYIGSGRPVIGIGPAEGDAAKILKETLAGEMFGRSQEQAIENYLLQAIRDWQNGKSSVSATTRNSKYTRRNLTADLAGIINSFTS